MGLAVCDDGKCSIPTSIFNLVNNIAGAGLLTLSAAMAAGIGPIPALIICVSLGLISGHTFGLMSRVCDLTGEEDFRGLCSRLIGPNAAWMSSLGCALLCFSVCIVFTGFIGDIAQSMLGSSLPAHLQSRSATIWLFTGFVLLPLCLPRTLGALGLTSFLGLCAVVYTVIFIMKRAFDGTYKPGGVFFEELAVTAGALMPDFEDAPGLFTVNSKALVLASNLGLSFMAHYNAPAFHAQLRNPEVRRCDLVSWPSYLFLSFCYTAVMLAGYSLFGRNCQTMLLKNFASSDKMADVAMLATGASILFGFPLSFCGVRQGIVDTATAILNLGTVSNPILRRALTIISTSLDTPGGWRVTTLLMLAGSTAIAIAAEDVGVVVGVSGAILGSSFIYILPSILYCAAHAEQGSLTPLRKANMVLFPMGIFTAALGVSMTLQRHRS